jgi:hypothetical protein
VLAKVCGDFGVLLLLLFLAYFVVCDFAELLGSVYASFLFMKFIWLFILTCRNLLVKSSLGGC